MAARQKLLLLDDDQEFLDMYQDILRNLPSKPEIHLATSASRALALLEAEQFHLLISDLAMPHVDGLQVVSIVRRKFPEVRTAVLTAVADEQFRMRAYALGIDLFLEKPRDRKDVAILLDCLESLLDPRQTGGFRGVQSKNLVDILQLECLSQSSSILKVTGLSSQRPEGKIWIQAGEIIDAEVGEDSGTEAFRKILGWKTGHFEILPPDPEHPRRITTSYQGLLLETVQALDEMGSTGETGSTNTPGGSKLSDLGQIKGVEFLLEISMPAEEKVESWGLDSPKELAEWLRSTIKSFQQIGDSLQAGPIGAIETSGTGQHSALAIHSDRVLCAGFHHAMARETRQDAMKRIVAQWAS